MDAETTTEIASVGSNIVNSQTIQKLHQDALSKDNKLADFDAQQLVDILGGADAILSKYTSISADNNIVNNDCTLNQSQLNAIHHMLTNPTTTSPTSTIIDNSINGKEIDLHNALQRPKPENFTHYLSSKNTALHACTQKADAIIAAIYNTKWAAFMSICALIYLFCNFMTIYHEWYHYFRAIVFPLMNLWLMCICVTVNRRAFAIIITSFEFWLKVLECIAYVSCDIFMVFVLREWRRDDLQAWIYVQFLLLFLMAIIVFSLFDAINMSVATKCGVGSVVALITTFQAWLASSFNWEDDEIVLHPFQFKLSSFMSGAIRTLALFVWKQTFFTFMTKGKHFITFGYKPFVQWIDESQNEQMVAEAIVQSQEEVTEHNMESDDDMLRLPTTTYNAKQDNEP